MTANRVMCTVPLDLERKFEQRWAARFARRVLSAPQGHELGAKTELPAALVDAKKNARRDKAHDKAAELVRQPAA